MSSPSSAVPSHPLPSSPLPLLFVPSRVVVPSTRTSPPLPSTPLQKKKKKKKKKKQTTFSASVSRASNPVAFSRVHLHFKQLHHLHLKQLYTVCSLEIVCPHLGPSVFPPKRKGTPLHKVKTTKIRSRVGVTLSSGRAPSQVGESDTTGR